MPAHWQRKYALAQHAINLGASEIQLDYIRYNTNRSASHQNAHNIHKVIRFFKQKLSTQNVPLQIDVFGETSFKPSHRIGQNIQLFANSVDAICPMVYPSHYEPYRWHARNPYRTVYGSLMAIQKQFNQQPPFRVYAYIELYNYRYPLSNQQKQTYIYEQIRAVEDGRADGWFAWSSNNQYENLFRVLHQNNLQ